jgi:two-component system response regulator HydG
MDQETAFVLVIDNDEDRGQSLIDDLRSWGHAARAATDISDSLESIKQRSPDAVILVNPVDLNTGPKNGLATLKSAASDAHFLILADKPTDTIVTETADTLEITKQKDTVFDLDVPRDTLRKRIASIARTALKERARRSKDADSDAPLVEGILGQNLNLQRQLKRAIKVARTKATVLIYGESGTGKELVARAIHDHSPRKDRPFRVYNCAALPAGTIESELFGHVKGSFTSAIGDRRGIIEDADGGTFFLDEVGDMPLLMQAKLLRTIEHGEIVPVGSNDIRQVNVRFVAATHRDLWQMVEDGTFREDLYYRLKAHAAIRLPSLRERRDDIPLLAYHFLELANEEYGMNVEHISTEAMRKLTNHSWRGNIRELRNVIEQIVIESESDTIEVADLPDDMQGGTDIVPAGPLSLTGMTMADVERLHILTTLRAADGNREKAAQLLQIGTRTLYRKLKEYGVT